MEILRRWAPVAILILICLLLHRDLLRRLSLAPWMQARPRLLRAARILLRAMSAWMLLAVPLLSSHRSAWIPSDAVTWALAASLFWILAAAILWLLMLPAAEPAFSPARRRMLALALPAAAAAAPAGGAGFGIVLARYGLAVREQEIVIPSLPRDLEGLRIVQLTDIHYGPFFGPDQLRRAVGMANDARPHIAVLTGDLITRTGDDLDGCLDILRFLRTEAGVFGCHGNHEKYADAVEHANREGARRGITFLERRSVVLRFGSARLNLAGAPYFGNLTRALPQLAPLAAAGSVNVLLEHNPAHFPAAAAAGFQLMLAGHTHGGQINLPVLRENINIARAFTQFVRGPYELGRSRLYVSCGLGTIGVPVRIGAPPEVSLIRLCAG